MEIYSNPDRIFILLIGLENREGTNATGERGLETDQRGKSIRLLS